MNEETEETGRKEKVRRPRRPQSRRRRLTIGFWTILTNLMLAILVFYAVLSFTETALSVPRWITDRVENEANAALPSGSLSIGKLALRVNDAGLPSIQASNLGVFDGRGVELARLNNAAVRLSPQSLFGGEIRPRFLDVSGAQITVRRRSDGQFDLSFGGTGPGTTNSLPGLLDELDRAFSQDFLGDVDALTARDLTISLEDARSGRVWQITDGVLLLKRIEDGLDIEVDFAVFNGTVDLAETQLRLRTFSGSSKAEMTARFSNAAAPDIALQSPALSYLSVLNAPISGSVRTGFSDDGSVGGLNGSLEIGQGALQPTTTTLPVRFDSARAFFGFIPSEQKITFSELSVDSNSLRFRASGQAYLKDFEGNFPNTLLGQFSVAKLEMNPGGMWDSAPVFDSGAADLRVRLAPFSAEFGQILLNMDESQISARGSIEALDEGWRTSADLAVDRIGVGNLVQLWPRTLAPRTRDWLGENMTSGHFEDIRFAFRNGGGKDPRVALGYSFHDAVLRLIDGFPHLQGATGYGTFEDRTVTVVIEEGTILAPTGGTANLAGSVFQVPDTSALPSVAELSLNVGASATSVLSLLSLPPINALAGSEIGPEDIEGEALVSAFVTYPMSPELSPDDIRYDASGVVTAARSDALVPGKTLISDRMDVAANNLGVEVSGEFRIGQVEGRGRWIKRNGPEFAGQSDLSGTVNLSRAFTDEFDIGLPDDFLSGEAVGQFDVGLRQGEAPSYRLTSTLTGASLAIPELSWSKAANATGAFQVEGALGTAPTVDRLSLSAPGLALSDGRVTFREAGGLDRASFGQASVGNWLSAPVDLIGRGPGISPRVEVLGGVFDLRRANVAGGQGGDAGVPISARLDRLVVTDGITLTDVQGDLDTSRGLSGSFEARVNGGARITGDLEPAKDGTAVRIRSSNGGRVLRDAGVFPAAQGGEMELILSPRSDPVLYRGRMTLTNTNVQRAPVLTELLSALSVVGLLDQMRGAGIVFSDVEAVFDIGRTQVNLVRSSAVGPSLGVSLDGIYDLTSSTMNMQGVISPVYFLNAVGQLISPRRGEGLFGFNFRLTGVAESPTVQVNPLSILTPGAFRDIFRSPPPEPDQ